MNAFLFRTQLCVHNLHQACKPPKGRKCNYAHWLRELQVPEEFCGNWEKAWDKGDVDICFWDAYHPNSDSVHRFSTQFLWEQQNHSDGIPNWAWGHALKLAS